LYPDHNNIINNGNGQLLVIFNSIQQYIDNNYQQLLYRLCIFLHNCNGLQKNKYKNNTNDLNVFLIVFLQFIDKNFLNDINRNPSKYLFLY